MYVLHVGQTVREPSLPETNKQTNIFSLRHRWRLGGGLQRMVGTELLISPQYFVNVDGIKHLS